MCELCQAVRTQDLIISEIIAALRQNWQANDDLDYWESVLPLIRQKRKEVIAVCKNRVITIEPEL